MEDEADPVEDGVERGDSEALPLPVEVADPVSLAEPVEDLTDVPEGAVERDGVDVAVEDAEVRLDFELVGVTVPLAVELPVPVKGAVAVCAAVSEPVAEGDAEAEDEAVAVGDDCGDNVALPLPLKVDDPVPLPDAEDELVEERDAAEE